ncbi:MAG TPA: sulfotransferase domain-containing protein [Fimbriimonadaceae bacterium]|jgi:hypothetical protein
MSTYRLKIKEKRREYPIQIVGPSDFETESLTEINPQAILDNPAFSLYCFDRESDAVLFVECDDPGTVESAPFYYQAQYDHAIGLARMPLSTFHQIAAEIELPRKGLIFVHSVGRCGSTLVSKALAAVTQVHSLSEPDDLTQLTKMAVSENAGDGWVRNALNSAVRWRCKPRAGSPAQHVAIKTRSEVLVLADFFKEIFPDEKHFFLYRNAVTWMQSYYSGYGIDRDVYDRESNKQAEESWGKILPIIQEYRHEDEPLSGIQIRVLAWITCMEGYLKLRGLKHLSATRFEDLTASPTPTLKKLFAFCEIDSVDWAAIEEVLSRDSQAGTMFDREERKKTRRELTDRMVQEVHDLVATRPLLGKADIVLEGSVKLV